MSTFCRLVAATVFCVALGLMLTACSGREAAATVQMTSALAQVKVNYAQARHALEARVAQLPEQTGVLWREFIRDADAYKAALETMWLSAAVSHETMAALYETGVGLYARAHALIAPDLGHLPLNDQILLRQMDAALRRLAEAYQQWLNDPEAQRRSDMVSTGLELVKLALQLGVAVL